MKKILLGLVAGFLLGFLVSSVLSSTFSIASLILALCLTAFFGVAIVFYFFFKIGLNFLGQDRERRTQHWRSWDDLPPFGSHRSTRRRRPRP
jgi:hypothetical protein